MRAACLLAGLMAAVCPSLERRAAAYEFEISARTTAQVYSMRWYRFSESDRFLGRRLLTQALGLEMWDLLAPPFERGVRRRADPPPRPPFELYLSGQLRIDHDFGAYTQGTTSFEGSTGESATTAVPELGSEDLGVKLLYGFVGVRGVGGFLDAELGRQIVVDSLDWFAFDGLHVRIRLPLHVALEGLGGLLQRDSSPVGFATHEPDGTSDAQCQIFESGAFVDSSDCPQRTQPAPTFGVALATSGLRDVSARVSYRRSVSATAAGVYPEDAPSSGVLEEKLAGDARVRLLGGDVIPWAAARWNFLIGRLDEAHAGIRLARGTQALTLEGLYRFPSFDGDSIFNVFAIKPYWDARATYDVRPGGGPLRAYARSFYRRFENDDTGQLPDLTIATSASAAGAGLGGRWDAAPATFRLDLYYEDGYGGLRAGGALAGRWPLTRRLSVDGRASLVRIAEDSLANLKATTLGLQVGGVWLVRTGVTVRLVAEENSNQYDRSQLRIIAILDLAYKPEH